MNKDDVKLLEKYGWDVVCYSPFEIEMQSEDGMVLMGAAKGDGAEAVLELIKLEEQLGDK